jgi:plastocyanin
VHPYWVGVTRCLADPIFNVPGGGPSVFTKARQWVVPRNGRIVAAQSHMHGGARGLTLSQPGCGNRTLFASRPGYGLGSHSLYRVNPLVHEPGPLTTDSQRTKTGIPVRKGTRLTLRSDYDGDWLHTRVMGIMHVYMARAHGRRPPRCAALPKDVVTTTANRLVGPGVNTTAEPPHVNVPLARLGPDGIAHDVERVPADPVALGANPLLQVANFAVTPPSVVVAPGTKLTWRFGDRTAHDVTVTHGPRGFASPPSRTGDRYSTVVTQPGTYSLICTRHPLTMQQTVEVR